MRRKPSFFTTLAALLLVTVSALAEGGREVPRRLLVLFGADPQETGGRMLWPPDTQAAQHLQTPLEWMGYETDYQHILRPLPALPLAGRYAGVIIDGTLKVPYAREEEFAKWVAELRQKNPAARLLFVGDIPLNTTGPRTLLDQTLGLRGTGRPISQPKDLEFARRDEAVTASEVALKPSPMGFADLQAPEGAEVFLSVGGKDQLNVAFQFDPLFLTAWGGALLDPYIYRQFSSNHILQLFDPFVFLAKIFPFGTFPAPDTSTRDGLRLFYSHIDGDAFTAMSQVASGQMNGEVIRDRILKKYTTLPITVSVVEANMRALEKGQEASKIPLYEAVAKEIFLLPNVQAASHTFSHPLIWMDGDDDLNRLKTSPRNLTLKPEAKYPAIDPVREVTGSVEFINKRLLPPGKKCDLLLWSGNCRPPPQAIAAVRKLGIEQMNGGNTIQSRRWPGRAGAAPRTTMMGDELQVYAANQNEMYYTDNWLSPFLGGFASVLETFQMTGQPRRLKAVNVYYHFYSGERGDALGALESVYNWCLAQPLHAVTAVTAARITRDSRDTVITQLGPGRWRIGNGGHLRTLRLPVSSGYPVTSLASGVTGWNDFQGQRFFHTTGAQGVELALADKPPASPALLTSTEETEFTTLNESTVELKVSGLKPARAEFHLPGGAAAWEFRVDGKVAALSDSGEGRFLLEAGCPSVIQGVKKP